MLRYAPIVAATAATAAGALFVKERRARIAAERLGAATLETLLDAIEANNPTTGSHVRRVADYALILADSADCDERMKRSIERVALFHDIGKIDSAVTDIIDETTRLTPVEKRAIRTHPRRGAEVLQPLSAFYPDLAAGVLAHHERWDGIAARLVAIADTFDAVTHSRSYRGARSAKRALQVIESGRGTQFDPDLVDLFLSEPVIDSVLEMMRRSHKPQRKGGKRHGRPGKTSVPDITFRWRTQAPSRQRTDR